MKTNPYTGALRSFLLLIGLLVSPLLAAQGTFDPVHEDTDIFLVNPTISSQRPNVLILLDNTANWNTPFDNEKAALVSVVNGLNEFFNVGIAMFPETGNPNDSIDGSYIRFGVRQMATANKTALSTMVNALDKLGDKGNNATPALAIGELYNYFAGLTSYSGWGKVKSDYAGNTTYNPLAASLAGNAFAQQPTEGSAASKIYTSPVVDNCQKNFIIYISNGAVNENSSALATARTQLEAAKGSSATTIAINPSGQQGNWADEWAAFMANTGFEVTIDGTPQNVKVTTYTIEVDPAATGQGPDTTALMQSIATQGKGKYFSTSSSNSGSSLIDALNQIFNEIQSVNSVFASTTLPVSVNVRGTNLNQVYIGMFRPDASKAPRWYGNLKLYKLALNASNRLILTDSLGDAAEDPNTGFVSNSAMSFWTHDSNFWNYRSSDENGTGGGSDSPDGDLVEKGAVAQRLRDAFAASQTARNLFTCVGDDCDPCSIGGDDTAETCSNSVELSSMPFDTDNDDITALSLGLGIKSVASLTAKVTKSVSALVDRRTVSISNAGSGAVAISALSNGATTKTVTSLNTTRGPFPITTLTAFVTSSSHSTVANSVSGTNVTVKIAQGALTSNPCTGMTTVTITGNNKIPDGSYSITSTSNSTYTSGNSTLNAYAIAFTATTSGSPNNSGTIVCSGNSSLARATLSGHGFTNLQSVTITGAADSVFNGTFSITVVDANTFTYSLSSSRGATTGASVSGPSQTALGTTSSDHSFEVGDTVLISGASPSGYNGSFTIASKPSSTSFTYSVAAVTASPPFLTANTATGVTATEGGSTRVDVTTSANHGLLSGATMTISGADSCYNGTYTVLASPVPTATTFSYTAPDVCPQNFSTAAMVSTGYSAIVTATLANHGFIAGDSIVIDEGDDSAAVHRNTFTVLALPAPTSDTFTYDNSAAFLANTAPAGTYTVRKASNPLAYATSTSHGFATNDSITIAGASPDDYNGTRTITVVDANTFSYPLTAAVGAASGTVTASENTTTAVANVVNHGFANNSEVELSGATPNVFNGTFDITLIDANNFSYTIGSAQGDATGTILAAQGSGSDSERNLIINWVRGQDNQEDENQNGSNTDCRASVHNDVLHSRPAVINYNRYGGDNDVYVFYGGNDAIFRGVKGGTTNDASDPTSLEPGEEAWGFVPSEGFANLQRMRNNSPKISSSFKKPYFMDGPIGVLSVDGNLDGMLDSADSEDMVYLYVGARRGGRYIYSFDVTNPTNPKYRWKIDNTTSGFSELGYSWSQPSVVQNITGYTNPVLIFGGGYDPAVEDLENCTITSAGSASVTYFSGAITYLTNATGCTQSDGSAITAASTPTTTVSRTMGRALYVVDAITGELIWRAGPPGSGADLEVADMNFAIPSDVIVVRNESGGNTNRAYVGDTGGNVWRFDFNSANTANWKITKLAAVSDLSTKAGRRKFLFPPDVVGQSGFDAVLIGSGDREHPFDYSVTNRFYMFKDRGDDNGPATGTTYYKQDTNSDGVGDTAAVLTRAGTLEGTGNPVIEHSNSTDGQLFDATNNCLQECTGNDLLTAQTGLAASDGWFFTFGVGEKNIGNAVALNSVVFFNTNQPSTSSSNCESNLGIARQYKVAVADATAPQDTSGNGTLGDEDRSTVHAGGGYLPSPVHVVVQVPGPDGEMQTVEGVISGTAVEQPPGTTLNARTRLFWYKEID